MAERLRWARETREGTSGVGRPITHPAPTLEENWRSACRRLSGANWHQWNRCNQRLGDGFAAMMLIREDRAFVRICMLDGGQSLLDAERR